jgi:two-component system OmpR family sensor kinase
MSRLPIRLRLTAVFALVMAGVLAGVGTFVYLRLGHSLDEQLNESLQARADTLAALVRQSPGLESLTGGVPDDEGFAQVIGPDGSVEAATPGLPAEPLLSAAALARARSRQVIVGRISLEGLDGGEARVLAAPVESGGRRVVVLVGASLEDRHDALQGLLAQLFVAGPIALALSCLAGYALAGAALRPVEAMRERAAQISADKPGRRLPLPRTRDELFRLGETLNAMLARLEAGMARERRFVADASHELRTPLALLKAELELALRRPRSGNETERALRSAAEEVDRLARLAEDLLVLARADEGRLPLRLSEVPVRDLLESVAHRFSMRADAAGRTVAVAAPSDGSFSGDRLRMEQALGNLVDNALRYGSGTVLVAAESKGDGVTFRVSDQGAGFPPDFLPRAFERFSRADEARSGGAAGLGLTIVDAIARAHRGVASAVNRPGGGAEVTLSLPAGSLPADEAG